MISPNDQSYQKTDLKCVRDIDASKIYQSFVNDIGISEDQIKKLVV